MTRVKDWIKKHWDNVETALMVVGLLFVWVFIGEIRYIPSGSMIPTFLIDDRLVVDKVTYRFRDPQRGEILIFTPPGVTGDAYIKRLIGLPGDQMRIEPGELQIKGRAVYRGDLAELFLADQPELTQRFYETEARETKNLNYRPSKIVHLLDDGAVVGVVFANQEVITERLSIADIARLFQTDVTSVKLKGGGVWINGQKLEESYIAEDPNYSCPSPQCFKNDGSQEFTIPAGNYFMMGDNRNNSQDSHAWGFLPKERIIGKALVRIWPLNRIGVLP